MKKNLLFFSMIVFAGMTFVGCGDDADEEVMGCTDSMASNYNANATVDDGSCMYLGCTDPMAANYNPQATEDDGSCMYEGCMDPQANNYDPQATIDDGSCTYDRDQFIGTYVGDITFTGSLDFLTTEDVTFTIDTGVDPEDKSIVIVSMAIAGIPLAVDATVEGNSISLDQMLTNIPIDFMGFMLMVDINVTGTLSLDGNALTGGMNVEIPAVMLSDEGQVDATKQ